MFGEIFVQSTIFYSDDASDFAVVRKPIRMVNGSPDIYIIAAVNALAEPPIFLIIGPQ